MFRAQQCFAHSERASERSIARISRARRKSRNMRSLMTFRLVSNYSLGAGRRALEELCTQFGASQLVRIADRTNCLSGLRRRRADGTGPSRLANSERTTRPVRRGRASVVRRFNLRGVARAVNRAGRAPNDPPRGPLPHLPAPEEGRTGFRLCVSGSASARRALAEPDKC